MPRWEDCAGWIAPAACTHTSGYSRTQMVKCRMHIVAVQVVISASQDVGGLTQDAYWHSQDAVTEGTGHAAILARCKRTAPCMCETVY